MTTETPEDQAFEQWSLAEQAYESFLQDKPERIILRQMSDEEFLSWLMQYRVLHERLYMAQSTYYSIVRTTGRESGEYLAQQAQQAGQYWET